VSSVVEQIHAELGDLIGEIGQKNRVRVTVHRALPKGQGRTWAWSRGEVVSDITGVGKSSEGEMLPLLPHLVMMDELRMLVGKRPQFLPEAMRRTGGEFISVTPNLRTTVGIDYVASALGDSSGSRAACSTTRRRPRARCSSKTRSPRRRWRPTTSSRSNGRCQSRKRSRCDIA
jgi:hypothetical protein